MLAVYWPSLRWGHHHHHQFLNREGRWGTTDDFAISFLHFSLFSTALWDLANSRPVHSLMLSSHLFLCLPCLHSPFTVPCKMFWPDMMNGKHDHTTAVCVSCCVKDINLPSLPTPFYFVPVSVSVAMALSTVFHSINSLDNSPLSHCVLRFYFCLIGSFNFVSLYESLPQPWYNPSCGWPAVENRKKKGKHLVVKSVVCGAPTTSTVKGQVKVTLFLSCQFQSRAGNGHTQGTARLSVLAYPARSDRCTCVWDQWHVRDCKS